MQLSGVSAVPQALGFARARLHRELVSHLVQ